jgi:two-component system, OmpR family, copper resistance phosphate regulon response regulator CusR
VIILIVEDQYKIQQSLRICLEENGFKVDCASDGSTGYDKASTTQYDIIILDVLLPDINGIDLCKKIRQEGINTPILFLSALDSVEDKITGLEAGGDDYLGKPFSLDEVVARIKALRRRFGTIKQVIKIGNLEIYTDAKEALRDGKNLNLTKKEFRLLEYFVNNQGKLLTKSEIAENVWDISFDTGTNIVEVYVNYLRNKLDKGYEEKLIQTKFGHGYIFGQM